jgi:TolB-like protein
MDGDTKKSLPEVFRIGGLTLDLGGRSLTNAEGKDIPLRRSEFALMAAFTRRPGRVLSRDQLLDELGSRASESFDRSIDVLVGRLRKKVESNPKAPRLIVTVPGEGYKLTVKPEPVERVEIANIVLPLVLPNKPSIAVLPFLQIGGDPEQEYFADGIVEDIITALARFPSLFVIARTSTFTYKGRSADIKQVGRELGVRYILEGSVRKAGNHIRICGQLIQADTGTHVWAERYDGELSDIFKLQDDLTASVVGSIMPSLQRAEIDRVRNKPPESLDAYDLYLRALPRFYESTLLGNKEALSLVERALAVDPNFISALVLGVNCWSLQFTQGWCAAPEAHAECMRYAWRAAQLDKDSAEAVGTLARQTAAILRKHEEAASLAEKAVALNPNSAFAWRQGGYALIYCGSAERALSFFRNAVRLSPRDPRSYDAWTGMAQALLQLEKDGEAIGVARKATQENRNYAPALRALAASLGLTGKLEEAKVVMRQMLAIDPDCSITTMAMRFGYTQKARERYFEGMRRAGLPE